jgi:hypothetical protein
MLLLVEGEVQHEFIKDWSGYQTLNDGVHETGIADVDYSLHQAIMLCFGVGESCLSLGHG